MASDLIDTCMAETKRTYGAGYGFALGYLTTSPGVWELRRMFEQANEIASRMIRRKSFHKLGITSDVVDYVEARANAPRRSCAVVVFRADSRQEGWGKRRRLVREPFPECRQPHKL